MAACTKPNSGQNPEECDATGFNSSNTVGIIKKYYSYVAKSLIMIDYHLKIENKSEIKTKSSVA